MAQRRVRWAMISFPATNPETGREIEKQARRGDIVDLPDDLATRYDADGATIGVDADLDRVGKLMELPRGASDGEIIHWVLAAAPAELVEMAQRRQDLASKIDGVRERLANENDETAHILADVADLLANNAPATPIAVFGADDDASDTDVEPKPDGFGDFQETTSGPPDTLADVVKGSVGSISAYLADHPDQAQDVLDAETESRDGDPRPGVVKACEVAAAHTGQ